MADKKQDGTPSADEIIEALAQEMGVDNDKQAESDEADAEAPAEGGEAAEVKETEPEPEPEPESKGKKSSDPMAGLGGIFEVPSGGSSKKKSKKAEKKPEPKAEVKVEKKAEPKAEKKAEKKAEPKADEPSKSSAVATVDAIFNVSGDAVSEPDASSGYDDLDDDRDLAKFERKAGGGTTKLLVGVIVALVLGMSAMAVFGFGLQDDIVAVFNGTYRDKKDAEKRRIEEEHRKQQLELMEKYGALRIGGEPNHALIKVQFENDPAPRPLFAQYGPDSPWRELRTATVIQNLKIKKPINVRIEAPGYMPQTVTLTENMWTETALGEFQYELTLYLTPANPFAAEELADRKLPFEEEEEDIAGTIFVTSKPAGAKIKLNNKLVVDKDGNPILTTDAPLALTEIPDDPEDDKKRKEPQKLSINTPPDNGYKVELFFDDPSKPKYVTVVQRGLWDCKLKDDKELERLKKDARPILKCNYTYNVVGDFEAIDAEIRRQKLIEEEMRKQKEEMEKLQKAAEEQKNKK